MAHANTAAWNNARGHTLKLPERDEDHHFDAKEFAHWFDWTQFFSQSPVEQDQAVHGKLGRRRKFSYYVVEMIVTLITNIYQLRHVVDNDQVRPRVG